MTGTFTIYESLTVFHCSLEHRHFLRNFTEGKVLSLSLLKKLDQAIHPNLLFQVRLRSITKEKLYAIATEFYYNKGNFNKCLKLMSLGLEVLMHNFLSVCLPI